MAILAYQFPGEGINIFKGKWIEKNLKDLPSDCFFITDFIKNKTFYFIEEETIAHFRNTELFFNKEDAVFVASGKAYLNGLQWFIDGFEENGISKAIYSRIKLEPKDKDTEMESNFRHLAKAYKEEALIYLVSDEKLGTWMGATPEVLLSGNQENLHSMALAGTKQNESGEWTEKELEEHQYVVDDIKEKIESQSPKNLKISATETVKKGKVFHLQTNFEFHLPTEKWNTLMDELHPTPAVCGTPTDIARDYILNQEPHSRDFYTGLIGWKSKEQINVYVNLRCMQVLENNYALYVGGGITLASDIGKELQETEDKSETLISIIVDAIN